MLTKYEREDIIPIVIVMLTVISQDLYNFVFKYAVDAHYPDLKPFLTEDEFGISDANFELLSTKMDDEVIILINTYLIDIRKQMGLFADIFGKDTTGIYKDERILLLVKNIYWSVLDFPDDMALFPDSRSNLKDYVDSTLFLLHYLCKLVVFEVLDLNCEFSDDIYNSFYEDSFTLVSVKEDVNEMILFELLLRSNDYNLQLQDLLQKLDVEH